MSDPTEQPRDDPFFPTDDTPAETPAGETAAGTAAPGASAPGCAGLTGDERTWGMLSYVLGRVAPIIAPTAIYMARRDSSPFVAFHAKQSLFLDIGCLGVSAAALGLAYVLQAVPLAGLLMARQLIVASWGVWVVWLLAGIILGIQAYDGQKPKFPLFGSCCGLDS